jgi:hypothetical protein
MAAPRRRPPARVPLALLPDWEARLVAWREGTMDDPELVWGRNDCLLSAASAVEAQCGTHPAPELVGRHTTRARAMAFVRRAGGIGKVVERYLGPPLPHPGFRQRGDVLHLVVQGPEGREEIAGVAFSDGAHVRRLEGGLMVLPYSAVIVLAAWGVGREATGPEEATRAARMAQGAGAVLRRTGGPADGGVDPRRLPVLDQLLLRGERP